MHFSLDAVSIIIINLQVEMTDYCSVGIPVLTGLNFVDVLY